MVDVHRRHPRAISEVDPNLTILRIRPLDTYIDDQLNSPRLLARLTTLYGALALLVACVGLYGVTAYAATRRTRDLGVRMALGATRMRVIMTVCRDALAPIAAGIIVGVPAAIAGGRAIASQLFGVGGADVLILAEAVLTLGACGIAAAVIPAPTDEMLTVRCVPVGSPRLRSVIVVPPVPVLAHV